MDTTIIIQAVAVAMFTKTIVDIIKISPIPVVGAALPVIGIFLAFGITLLMDVTNGQVLNGKTCASAALVAILAAGSAAGVTALQNKGNQPA